MNTKKQVVVLTGAGQLGMAIVRRMAYGHKIFIADWKMENAEAVTKILVEAGFDAIPFKTDISSRASVKELIIAAQQEGEIVMFINAAGLSPLTPEEDKLLATTPTEELLQLEMLQPENIKDTLHAYQIAKRCNVKRVMAEAVLWGERGARLNSISPGIIITPLALDEINGPRGDFYRNMFFKSPAGRPGIADEVANVAELLLSEKGAFITGADFLIDGGATASYFYGPLQPKNDH